MTSITAQLSEAITQLHADFSVLKGWTQFPESQILCDFQKIFEEFRGKHFELLWRDSRDGFKTKEFHRRCDGHANTLTVILDTKGNIFGEFTPVEGESKNWRKADDSQKSFIFTLTNPHKVPAKKLTLKAEEKDSALFCAAFRGPHFSDILVNDNCNTNNDNYTSLDSSYINDMGMDGRTFFTGSEYFRVKEIEVFEITE
jgi:hypothetical protein